MNPSAPKRWTSHGLGLVGFACITIISCHSGPSGSGQPTPQKEGQALPPAPAPPPASMLECRGCAA